jgi:hypothetical protein
MKANWRKMDPSQHDFCSKIIMYKYTCKKQNKAAGKLLALMFVSYIH